jgi:hypothetical protein
MPSLLLHSMVCTSEVWPVLAEESGLGGAVEGSAHR